MADFDPKAYLASKKQDDKKFDPKEYLASKKEIPAPEPRAAITGSGLLKGTAQALPYVGGAIGGVLGTPLGPAGSVGGAGLGYAGGKSLENTILAAMGDQAAPQTREEIWKQTAQSIPEGMTQEMGGQILGKALNAAAPTLKSFAEKAAVNATGATGKQATTFSEDAGRELLDRGIVKFGSNQSQIAERASKAVSEANSQIDSALSNLEKNGVSVDADKIKDSIQAKISKMKSDPSKADIRKMLEKELENISDAIASKGGSKFGVLEAEQTKRGYNRKAGNWADPEKGMVGKEMYQTYRGAVEDAARSADPETAKLFEEGKKSYGLLSPIQEAAERRAATTAQSPAGGLADISAAGAGLLGAGPAGAIVAPIGRRVIAPRMSSSAAAGADALSQLIPTLSPQQLGLLKGLIDNKK